MKKNFIKKLSILIFTFILMIGVVNAETISSKFTINSRFASSTPVKFPEGFTVKKTSTGKYAYCTYYEKNYPTGQTFKKSSKVSDPGMAYILKQSIKDNANSDSDFFVYQTALWVYMVDKGIMPGSTSKVKTFKTNLSNSSSTTAKKIKNLVSNAKKASAADTKKASITIGDTSNIGFTLENDKYVSDKITINSNTSDYKITITEGPNGTTYEKGTNYVRIIIPASTISALTTNVKFKVNNSKTLYSAYIYKTSNSAYQPMAVPFKENTNDNASASLKLTTTKDVTISKQDVATSKELPGATLQLTNSNGKIIDTWVSTTTPHIVKGLSAGTYELKETIQPDGYILSQETIKFTINENGKLVDANGNSISKIVMYNKLKENKDVYISKQDITSKEELKGAELVLKDNSGNVVDKWISDVTPHVIKNLKEGTYTLTETNAPDGYVLSKETITFAIDKDGNLTDANGNAIDKVIMYNEKEVPKGGGASISKQDITNKKELPGAILVLKDYDGNLIKEWESGTTPTYIELKPGIYTLNEKFAPNGYILSDETITFTVKEDGSVTEVVMYNTPNSKEVVEVEDTASFKSIIPTILGLSIIAIGMTLLFKNKKIFNEID